MATKKSKILRARMKDRLSALPDDILCQILSLLSTKDAVVTSLLSARWKHLYRSLPKIELDDLAANAEQRNCSETTSNGFVRFTNRMLFLRNGAQLVKFHLRCFNTYEDWIINDWIGAALCRNVLELDIHVPYQPRYSLNSEIFRHEVISSLKLYGFCLRVPKLVCLPNLKILHLRDVTFLPSDYRISEILLGCPLLEDFLFDCELEAVEAIDISIPSLKRLTLEDNWNAKITVSCPNLEYLVVDYESPSEYELKNLKSLVSARVLIPDLGFCSDIIDELCQVSSLSITGSNFEALANSGFLSKLQYLTHLELATWMEIEYHVLPSLLAGTPNLQQLTIDMGRIAEFEREGILSDVFEVKPLCLAQKLRKVELFDFVDSNAQFNLVEYLLHHGALLELMIFSSRVERSPEQWPAPMLRKLLKFPRCSKTCKIVLGK